MLGEITKRLRLGNFLKDKNGNVAITAALSSLPLIFMVGVTIDYSSISREKSELQELADAAALYSVLDIQDLSIDESVFEAKTKNSLTANYEGDADTITTDLDKTSQTLEIVMTKTITPAFMGILPEVYGMGSFRDVEVSALAEVTYSEYYDRDKNPFCLFSGEEEDKHVIDVSGGAELIAKGCTIQVNSSSDEAVKLSGNGSIISAGTVCIVGGAETKGSTEIIAEVTEGCSSEDNPFADLKTPPVGSRCTANDKAVQDTTRLSPGVYCGGLSVSSGATALLNPGTYIIKDGPLTVNGNAKLIGDGVLLYFIGDNISADFNGGGEISLTAPDPEDADYLENFVIYFDTDSSAGSSSKFNGGANTNIEGVVYLGDGGLTVTGDGSINADSGLSIIIAREISIGGGAELILGFDETKTDLEVPEFLFEKSITAYLSK